MKKITWHSRIKHLKLRPPAKCLLYIIADYCGDYGIQEYQGSLTTEHLGAHLALATRWVDKAIKQLLLSQYIEIEAVGSDRRINIRTDRILEDTERRKA